MKILTAREEDFDELIDVWEDSVRATHGFLAESDIYELRKLIRQEYFYLEDLYIEVVKDKKDKVLGFLGTSRGNIEMLFIQSKSFGKKIGTKLLEHAILYRKCTKVEVNEQNSGALKFYQKHGFRVVGYSELDHQGNAFPILYLELRSA